jgi:hypothetical protein
MLMVPGEPPELGGEMKFPRGGKDPSSLAWYLENDHSLPPTDTGESGALRSLMVLMVGGNQKEEEEERKRLAQTPQDGEALVVCARVPYCACVVSCQTDATGSQSQSHGDHACPGAKTPVPHSVAPLEMMMLLSSSRLDTMDSTLLALRKKKMVCCRWSNKQTRSWRTAVGEWASRLSTDK